MPEIVPKREYVSIYFKNYTKCKLNLSWQRADHRLPAEGGVIKGWRKPEEAMIMFTILCFIGGVRKSKLIQLYTLKSVGSNSKILCLEIVIIVTDTLLHWRPRFDSWVGITHWRRAKLPAPVFLGFPGGSDGKEQRPARLVVVPGSPGPAAGPSWALSR